MRSLLPAFLISIATFSAYGQDTRHVTEPTIPSSCTVLTARLASVHQSTLAEPDESKPDTNRIQQAMDNCKAGQAVELKEGGGNDAFLTGPLQLRQGVTLLIDKGVVLFGSRNPRDYDLVPGLCGTVSEKKYPYTPGISGHGCKALISGENIANAAIMGDGVIDGRGGAKLLGQDKTWWDVDEDSLKTWPHEYYEWAHEVGIDPEVIKEPAKFVGLQNDPRMINLLHCDNFILYRIQLRNAPNFQVSYAGGNGFTIWGVIIVTPKTALNSDGIDIGQPWPEVATETTNVTITHSYIYAGDDDLAIKSRIGSPTSHVSVIHNHIYAGGGIGTGSSLSGGVSHILVSDLTLDGTGINMKTNDKLGGPVDDIEFNDVCIRNSRNPVHIVTHMNSTGHHEVDAIEHNKTPQYTNLRLNNVLIQGGGKFSIDGLDGKHRLGVSLRNVVAERPQDMETVADEANIEVDGSNLTFSGEDLKISGTSSNGVANTCQDRFVPFPVPVNNSRTVFSADAQ